MTILTQQPCFVLTKMPVNNFLPGEEPPKLLLLCTIAKESLISSIEIHGCIVRQLRLW